MRDHDLAALASRQYGVFTLDQAAAVGLSARTVEDRARRGLYEQIYPAVFAMGGHPPSWHRRVIAAVLSTKRLAAASHHTAAFLWGLTSWKPDGVEIVTHRHARVHREIVVHESTDLITSDVETVSNVPTTSAVRTVVDLGASRPRRLVESCLDAGLRTGLYAIGDVDLFVARVARRGRRGVGVIRPLVEQRMAWGTVTESQLEDLFRSVVSGAALPMPEAQYVVTDARGEFVCRADFALPRSRTLIELDSEAFHMSPEAFRRDREKQNRAVALGWRVLRFTWRQLVETPEQVTTILASIHAA